MMDLMLIIQIDDTTSREDLAYAIRKAGEIAGRVISEMDSHPLPVDGFIDFTGAFISEVACAQSATLSRTE